MSVPLRPLLPADVAELRDLLAQSIDGLAADDYNEDQRIAWAASIAEDQAAFAARLAAATTLVVEVEGELLGFGSLERNGEVSLLYVHPYAAGEGVGGAILHALERLADGRGLQQVTVEASENAVAFFETKGYVALRRTVTPMDGEWLARTSMGKRLKAAASGAAQ